MNRVLIARCSTRQFSFLIQLRPCLLLRQQYSELTALTNGALHDVATPCSFLDYLQHISSSGIVGVLEQKMRIHRNEILTSASPFLASKLAR